jgi:hypothetical protein
MTKDPTVHPSDATLYDYCAENVSEETLASIELHLNDCGDCARRVVAIVRTEMSHNGHG